ncbi:hypothetical protein HRR83_001630 [Exophiala dermatitidis]|uniref:Uncharacterized protein n=1 Tax=Exophiala dermatitidis TaxID=5970 RepID=A0AAN6F177_EXODE|nr:hypothetical protein HRR73_004764 [Exophiala dermatitidis]KAJ4526436.1 hypothetical protein HRR74_001634 [Exophiala dermatitidis]KAJ4532320.1 hypothetical protein HRR76_007317 [Exophiala dermatitidis]KAJ4546358.1 hypothetical protein HRR77_004891 [Exophiala dermatitidis]KAJ4567399.1 hypothetical protein HRR79_004918 [Exophiala dermatitidis]
MVVDFGGWENGVYGAFRRNIFTADTTNPILPCSLSSTATRISHTATNRNARVLDLPHTTDSGVDHDNPGHRYTTLYNCPSGEMRGSPTVRLGDELQISKLEALPAELIVTFHIHPGPNCNGIQGKVEHVRRQICRRQKPAHGTWLGGLLTSLVALPVSPRP